MPVAAPTTHPTMMRKSSPSANVEVTRKMAPKVANEVRSAIAIDTNNAGVDSAIVFPIRIEPLG